MISKEEIIKYAEELIAAMKNEKECNVAEIYSIINKIALTIGPEFSLIPKDLKSSLGIAWAETIDEPNTYARAVRTRSTFSILRAAVKIAHGPKKQILQIDAYIKGIDDEIKKCEDQGEDAKLDELWKVTNNAIDYITLLAFNGYGQIKGDGFKFSRVGVSSSASTGDNKK